MRKIKLFEEFTYNDVGAAIVYHGTSDEHEFNHRGDLFNGTFFSTSANEASAYGKYVYRLELKKDLNILDTNKIDDCKKIIEEFGPLEDPYYNNDEPEYFVNTAEELWHHSDNWSPIEADRQLMSWLEGNYDGIWVYEGGTRNLLLFNPVRDKIDKTLKVK